MIITMISSSFGYGLKLYSTYVPTWSSCGAATYITITTIPFMVAIIQFQITS
jgi:hypothetical protein